MSNIDLLLQLKLTQPLFIPLHCTFFAESAVVSSANRWNIKINLKLINIHMLSFTVVACLGSLWKCLHVQDRVQWPGHSTGAMASRSYLSSSITTMWPLEGHPYPDQCHFIILDIRCYRNNLLNWRSGKKWNEEITISDHLT